jgi:hypothetical protein
MPCRGTSFWDLAQMAPCYSVYTPEKLNKCLGLLESGDHILDIGTDKYIRVSYRDGANAAKSSYAREIEKLYFSTYGINKNRYLRRLYNK